MKNNLPSLSAHELASALDYPIAGNGETPITGIAYADEASSEDLAIAFSRQEAERTAANVILTAPHLLPTEKTVLFSIDEVGVAMIRAVDVLIKHGICPNRSAPPMVVPHNGYFVGSDVRLGKGSSIGPGAVICSGAILGDDCVVGANAYIDGGVSLADRVHIAPGARIGIDSFFHAVSGGVFVPFAGIGRVLIGHDTVIGGNTTIQRGTISDTVIGPHTQIGDLVEIGHDVKIGTSCKIVSQTGIAGNAVIGNGVIIYGQCGIANHVRIGDYAIIKGKTTVTKHVEPNHTVSGPFGREAHQELRIQAALNRFIKRKE